MLFTLLVCVGLIGLDQLVKWLMTAALAPDGFVTVIPGVLGFRYLENTGAAFSMLRGRLGFLIVVTGLALVVVAWLLMFKKPKDKLEYLALIFVFSGGVGNLIDRIANGYVVDYIELLFVRFAVFNLADIMVCLGFALLVVAVFRSEARQRRRNAVNTALSSDEITYKFRDSDIKMDEIEDVEYAPVEPEAQGEESSGVNGADA